MITYSYGFKVDKHAIRLNFPHATGSWRKIDRFVFDYSYHKDQERWWKLPCFLALPKLVKYLKVNGEYIKRGGNTSAFGEYVPITKVVVDNEQLNLCKQAYKNGYWKVQNFTYNGFASQREPGYAQFTVTSLGPSNDPGCFTCKCSDNKTRHIPCFYIEGYQIALKPRDFQPVLFGPPSCSK